ncbi:winged helix-turn-helix domain-containing protein [Shewanella sp. UCD-KL12]|uniref:winged helix-turn-helix domain-containing protein n=1 Tax=Shewanella sp. UCD-KL12 TaxID=1917163 RepID=UPI000970E4EE|nr:winged helix-turn-helix domain-containing protein [Shewanella sp. UCD-KL12]
MITQPRYRLADRLIDPSQCTILKDDTLLKVELRAMQVLVCLIKHAGEPVSRDMLLEEVWSGGEVSDNAINRIIGLLRNQLGDNAKSPSFIKTLPKVGYVLIAEVAFVKAASREEKFTEEVIAGSNIEERGVNSEKSLERKIFSLLYKYSKASILLFVGLVGVSFWFGWQFLFKSDVDVPLHHSTELKRLTFLDGQEFSPILSPDGKYLAFSQRELGEKNWRIGLMELESRIITYLDDPMDSQGFPAFSPDGSKVAYLSYDQSGDCRINLVKIEAGSFSEINTITSCKRLMQETSIVWKRSGKGLFFIDEDHQYDYLTEKKVFSIGIDGSNRQQLSQPYSIGRGDYSLSLSPDGRFIAVIRNVRWYQTQVMLLSLETGNLQSLFTLSHLLHTIAWDRKSGSLIYRSMTGNLTRYNLENKTHAQMTNIMQPIISPTSNQNGEVVAVLGDFFKTKILRIDSFKMIEQMSSLSSYKEVDSKNSSSLVYISSYGGNHMAATSIDGEKVAFISNRTGVPELWLKLSSGNEVQLSHFKSIKNIKDVSFSLDSTKVLGRVNNRPFVYDLTLKKFKFIKFNFESEAYSISWGPDSNSIVASVDVLGESKLKLLDIDSGKVIKVMASGGEYGKYALNGDFYYTKREKDGLWRVINGEEKILIKDFTIKSNLSWTVVGGYLYNLTSDDGIYFLDRIELSTMDKIRLTIPFDGLVGHSISVDENGIVLIVTSTAKNIDIIKLQYKDYVAS